MSNKRKGILLYLVGVFILLVSFFSDYFRGRPQYFGPAQITLAFLGLVIICFGGFLCGIKVKDIILSINNKLLPHRLLVTAIFFVSIMLLLIYPLQYVINYLTFPYPLEYRDAASIHAAVALSNGINPYSLQNFPENTYLYGLMFPLVLAPFMNLVDHPLMAAKGLEVVFLVLLLCISFNIFRKRKSSIISSLIGILILLNSTCFIWKINGTRPDVLGLFFCIFGFYVILKKKPDIIHIFLCALSCVVSFYFKQYMIFSALVVAIYLIFFVSKKKGFMFVAMAFAIGLFSFLVIKRYFPLYYEYSILHHVTIVGSNRSHMEMQAKLFLRYFWMLCILYLIYIYKMISDFGLKRLKEVRLKRMNFEDPIINGGSEGLFNVGIIVTALILTFILGRHQGNLYTYYGELLLPFLLFLIIPKIDELLKGDLLRYLFQALILVFCIFPFYENYITDFDSYQNAFLKVYKYADHCSNIYDETPLVALYKIEHKMKPIFNNGQIEYAWSAIPDKETTLGKFSTLPIEDLNQRLLEWNNGIDSSIKNQKFNCIFTEYEQAIEKYEQIAEIENVLDRTIYVWVPLKP